MIFVFVFFGYVGLHMEEPEPVHKRRAKRQHGHNWGATEEAQSKEDLSHSDQKVKNFFDH